MSSALDYTMASASAFGNAVSGALGVASTNRQFKRQKELMEYQYEKNLEAWKMQNEYNAPIAQRQRMEEAGFNPNLVYGHGTVANTASGVPQYTAPTVQAYTSFGNLGQSFIDSLLAMRKTLADVKKTEAEAEGAKYNARVAAVAADNAEEYGYKNASYESDFKLYDRELKYFEKEYEEKRSQYYDRLIEAALNNDEESVRKLREAIKNLEKQRDVFESQIELNKSKSSEADSATALNNAKTVTEGYRPSEILSGIALRNSQAELNRVNARIQKLVEEFYPSRANAEISKLEVEGTLINNKVVTESLKNNLTVVQIEDLMYKAYKDKVGAEYAEAAAKMGLFKDYAQAVHSLISSAMELTK